MFNIITHTHKQIQIFSTKITSSVLSKNFVHTIKKQ